MADNDRVLLVHDGELDDVSEILGDLHTNLTERRGRPTDEDQGTVWKAVIGTPRYVLELQVGAYGPKPVRVVLLSGDSRTLIAMLRRSGVDLMVRRPVHPTALRLLLLHALYSGPEKRRHPRITIGADVKVRTGWLRSREATLADLSVKGCRLLSSFATARDQVLKIQMPTTLGCSKSVTVEGRVLRSGLTNGVDDGQHATAVCFDAVTPRQSKGIREILERHARGPAVMSAPSRKIEPQAPEAAPEETEEPTAETLPSEAVPEVNERRDVDRADLANQRVIALGVEATRVLIGRDISIGGMRVEPNNQVKLGSEFRLAVHMRARQEPLVVSARATRDDGDDGMLLEFFDLSDGAQSYLEKMVNFLPILAARGGDTGSGVIVSEILEDLDSNDGSAAAAVAAAESDDADSDAEADAPGDEGEPKASGDYDDLPVSSETESDS